MRHHTLMAIDNGRDSRNGSGDLKGVAEKAKALRVRCRAGEAFLQGNGHNIGKIVQTTPATRLSVVDSQDCGKLLRTRNSCSPELLNVRFLNAFAGTNVHTDYHPSDIDSYYQF